MQTGCGSGNGADMVFLGINCLITGDVVFLHAVFPLDIRRKRQGSVFFEQGNKAVFVGSFHNMFAKIMPFQNCDFHFRKNKRFTHFDPFGAFGTVRKSYLCKITARRIRRAAASREKT